MRLNPNLWHGFHLAVELLLAALVWVLLRRLHAARQAARALETELGLVKKRFEAATSGLHIRLLDVERRSKLAAGAAAGASPRPASPQPAPLNRGESDLLRKVRQLRGE
jgi:hypothetical protein